MNQGCGSINAHALFNVALSLKNIAGSTLNVDSATLNVDRSGCFIERDSFNVEAACKDATGACQQFRIQGRFRAIPTMPGTRQRNPDPRRCCTACSSCRSAKACIWHCFFVDWSTRDSIVLMRTAEKMGIASCAISGPAIKNHSARRGALIGRCLSPTDRLWNRCWRKI